VNWLLGAIVYFGIAAGGLVGVLILTAVAFDIGRTYWAWSERRRVRRDVMRP